MGVLKTRLFAAAALAFTVTIAAGAAQSDRDRPRVSLIGLDQAKVEAMIGKPDETDTLADSGEVFWVYKTKAGTLTVHFQNGTVVDIAPEDFPLETILKRP